MSEDPLEELKELLDPIHEQDGPQLIENLTIAQAMLLVEAASEEQIELPAQWELDDLVSYVEGQTGYTVMWNDRDGYWEDDENE